MLRVMYSKKNQPASRSRDESKSHFEHKDSNVRTKLTNRIRFWAGEAKGVGE
jgi:hypothetical protein